MTFTDASVTAKGDGSTAITMLQSDGQDVHYVLLNGNTQLVAYTGTTIPTSVPSNATDAATAHVVFVATVSDADNDGGYSIVQYQQLDHDIGTTLFSTITLGFNFTATDADGDTATGTFTTTVNDTGPTVVQASVSTGVATTDPVAAASSTGTGASLGITWGADDGNSGTANRSVTFTNANVAAAGDGTTTITTLHSSGQDVYYVLLNGNTQLVAYTGTRTPTTVAGQCHGCLYCACGVCRHGVGHRHRRRLLRHPVSAARP